MSKTLTLLLSALFLLACLAAPVLHFRGQVNTGTYRMILLVASLGWFACAAILAAHRKR